MRDKELMGCHEKIAELEARISELLSQLGTANMYKDMYDALSL